MTETSTELGHTPTGMRVALKLIMERGNADQVETVSQVREAMTVPYVSLKLLSVTFGLVSPI